MYLTKEQFEKIKALLFFSSYDVSSLNIENCYIINVKYYPSNINKEYVAFDVSEINHIRGMLMNSFGNIGEISGMIMDVSKANSDFSLDLKICLIFVSKYYAKLIEEYANEYFKISYKAKYSHCSICGCGDCNHTKGKVYDIEEDNKNSKLCFHIHSEMIDLYSWDIEEPFKILENIS